MNEDSALDRKRRDFEDLNNEIAGLDTGRQQRFLPEGRRAPEIERKKREARAFQTMLMELMADPVYRAKYDEVMTTLQDAERATDTALDQIQSDIVIAQDLIDEMERAAARLPDPTLVFKDTNGVVRKADGSVVDDDLAATILWTGNEPRFEDYTAQQAHLDALETSLAAVQGYQIDVLGPARDRMTDPDNPPTLKELDAIGANITGSMPDAVIDALPASETELKDTALSMSVALPSLGG